MRRIGKIVRLVDGDQMIGPRAKNQQIVRNKMASRPEGTIFA